MVFTLVTKELWTRLKIMKQYKMPIMQQLHPNVKCIAVCCQTKYFHTRQKITKHVKMSSTQPSPLPLSNIFYIHFVLLNSPKQNECEMHGKYCVINILSYFMIFLLKHKIFGIIFISKSSLQQFKSKTRFKKQISIPIDFKGVIDTSLNLVFAFKDQF